MDETKRGVKSKPTHDRHHVCKKCGVEFLNRKNFQLHRTNNQIAARENTPQCNVA